MVRRRRVARWCTRGLADAKVDARQTALGHRLVSAAKTDDLLHWEKVAAAGASVVAVAGQPVAEGDVVGALQALGYSLPEAREAARHGLAMAGADSSLEERVKAALRVLVRD